MKTAVSTIVPLVVGGMAGAVVGKLMLHSETRGVLLGVVGVFMGMSITLLVRNPPIVESASTQPE